MDYPKTLNQFLLEHLVDHPNQQGLSLIMSDLATVGKMISAQTNRAFLTDLTLKTGGTNIQSEEVIALDDYCNELCKRYLSQTNHFAAMASEEEEGVVDMGEKGRDAKYVIAFDPLDGSKNTEVNMSIGTIFSVHNRLADLDRTDEKQFLQKGSSQVLAGFISYGPSTVLVFSFGEGVHEFTLDKDIGTFFLTEKNLTLPEEPEYYSINESYYHRVDEKMRKFIESLKQDKLRLRWDGSMVGDCHRVLKKGGVFAYGQVDGKSKLRLNYEAKPMAFLFEQAGGKGVDGENAIMEREPIELHERIPVFLGNAELVDAYLANE